MGASGSKQDHDAALLLCKERIRCIKQAINSRYALSAAQLSYVQSLRDVGSALRRFVEADTMIESSLSASEPGKSPSHSSYASPSRSPLTDQFSSPFDAGSPLTPIKTTIDSTQGIFADGSKSPTFPFPPPPRDGGTSWDFFDPVDTLSNTKAGNNEGGGSKDVDGLKNSKPPNDKYINSSVRDKEKIWGVGCSERGEEHNGYLQFHVNNGSTMKTARKYSVSGTGSETSVNLAGKKIADDGGLKSEHIAVEKELCDETEDASEFITHRAKDFLSSMKDIEHRFARAAESGHEVSRMLETSKIRLSISSEKIGKSSTYPFQWSFLICCKADNITPHESDQHVTKVITWNRSVSSQSSSSRNPLVLASKDDMTESGSDFIEEFCMISGSHSSTLDRLYAWERKLYDELKAGESIRKAYDKKCAHLRHQFAKELDARAIDKTRAIVKDLHSRLLVAIQAVDSISKRIEKLRDEELQPQVSELIQGLIRMWRVMLESHHAQHITISLAYHTKSSAFWLQSEAHKQSLLHLRGEIDCFSSSFLNWIKAQELYVEALNSWLQKCILQPQERLRGRKAASFSPRRAIAPPIFVLLRDWSVGIASLPYDEACDSTRRLAKELHEMFKHHMPLHAENRTDPNEENKEADKSVTGANVVDLQATLAMMFDRLTRFAETLLKVYEHVKQESEKSRAAYNAERTR